ncbi:MAG: SDR family oxidoreductase [Candidatus Tectomicrobia bacterium]
MDLGLEGKVAIITGGSEGIGKASALRLCEAGGEVTICARRPDVLQKAADEIKTKTGKEVLAVPADVCSDEQVQNLIQKTVERFGGIDILVNNAGGSRALPFLEAADEIWREDLEIKLFGAIRCAKAVIPYMRQRGGGRIINMTTVGGKAPGQKSLPTSVSRAAGINLTKSMATEYAAENILVNTICLGLLKSAQHERRYEQRKSAGQTLEQYYEQIGKRVPVGRVGEVEEVGDLVAFLASNRAAFITGTSINIDGGASAVV